MTGAIVLALLLAVPPAAAVGATPVELGQYREIVLAAQWSSCCASGVPHDIERRIASVAGALERRHGRAAIAAVDAAVRAEFVEQFGVYDPVGRRLTPGWRQRERRDLRRWYDARLDPLEARLGLAGR